MKCEQARELFAEALYGELDDRRTADFNAHLASCSSCGREYEGLKQTLAMMSNRARVEPSDADWREFSKKLDGMLAAEPGFGRAPSRTPENLLEIRPTNGIAGHETGDFAGADTRFPGSGPDKADRSAVHRKHTAVIPWLPAFRPAWGYGIAAMLLIAFGVYMGRTFFNGEPASDTAATTRETASGESTEGGTASPEATTPAPPVEQTAPESRAAGRPRQGSAAGLPAETALNATNKAALSYLERSRNLLIGLTNLDEKQSATLDLGRSRQVSRDLYDKGNTLAVALNQPSQQQLRQLVQNLQIILLQLSNMGVGNGTPAVELVRQGVDSKSILLKINLEAIRASLGEAQAGGPGEKSKQNL